MKARFGESLLRRLTEARRDIAIGNNCAATTELEPGAFLAQIGEKTSADLYVIATIAERDVDDHATRIRSCGGVSKVCRAVEMAGLDFIICHMRNIPSAASRR